MKKKWFWILAAALLAFTVKSIFVGANTDEAYGVTLGYRLVQGDRLLWDMWEPHQTSAIFTAVFIRGILFLTGGSLKYMTVFLRMAFFVVQAAITLYVYRCLEDCQPGLTKEDRILLSVMYYITTPKCNFVPEYSNLHVWFSTLLALFLMQYFCKASRNYEKRKYLVLAGSMLACDVLAYPSIVVFYPICAVVIWRLAKGNRRELVDVGMFTLPCVLGAFGLLCYLFQYMSVAQIRMVLPYIMGDGSHKLGLAERAAIWWDGVSELVLITAGCGGVAFAAERFLRQQCRKQRKEPLDPGVVFLTAWYLVQVVVQFVYWLHTEYSSGYPQVAYLMIGLMGLWIRRRCVYQSRTGLYLVGLSVLNFICLNLFSNWKPTCLTVYLVLGVLGGILCWRQYFCEKMGAAGHKWIRGICMVFVISEVFGRCFLVLGSETGNDKIYQVRGINREAVRAGTLVSYMNAYRYRDDWEHFEEIVSPGSMLLYLGPSQYYYMLGDCRVASPTTICTPEYDESLKAYFEIHPERFPDVVVLESTYGDVAYFSGDDYIYTWLREVYQPTETVDYHYVKVFRREVSE